MIVWCVKHDHLLDPMTRSEYITIASIMICMTVWDFVIGVLFGIIVSCVYFQFETYFATPRLIFSRRFLCGAKFTTSEHSSSSYRRDCHVHRAATQRPQSLHSRSLQADDSYAVTRYYTKYCSCSTSINQFRRQDFYSLALSLM